MYGRRRPRCTDPRSRIQPLAVTPVQIAAGDGPGSRESTRGSFDAAMKNPTAKKLKVSRALDNGSRRVYLCTGSRSVRVEQYETAIILITVSLLAERKIITTEEQSTSASEAHPPMAPLSIIPSRSVMPLSSHD